jgi:hypothetical protein
MKPILPFALLALAATAQAQVINISQAKALAGNVTPGDAPGFPVTISQPGSYKLTGNLTVADPAVAAIHITSPHVTLDLGGFLVQGPNQCSGSGNTLNCTSEGYAGPRGDGVLVSLPIGEHGARVHLGNGSIAGFYGSGVSGGTTGGRPVDVSRVRVSGNGLHGITNASGVTESSISRNRVDGLAFVTTAIGNTVVGNRSRGLHLSRGRHNYASDNGINLDAYTLLD